MLRDRALLKSGFNLSCLAARSSLDALTCLVACHGLESADVSTRLLPLTILLSTEQRVSQSSDELAAVTLTKEDRPVGGTPAPELLDG
jgi:hypothetical protein